MKARPILFSGEMVRALLDGRKTQTRRVIKPQPFEDDYHCGCMEFSGWAAVSTGDRPVARFTAEACGGGGYLLGASTCPYSQPGDLLWVRETHAIVPRTAYAQSVGVAQRLRPDDNHDAAIYRAEWDRSTGGLRWLPSIHMPRWASRLTLQLTDVRVERVQEIGREDALDEGVDRCNPSIYHHPKIRFQRLWDSINAKRGCGWDVNPWVWVLEFRPILANVDDVLADPAGYGVGEAA